MGMGPGKRHSGARLAVVCCWWGQQGKRAHMEERWHLMGQRTSPGSNTEQGQRVECCFAVSWTRAADPCCVHLYVSQKLHHQEVSSDPLGDLSSSSPTLCVCLYELRISLNPFPINYMTAKHFSVLAHVLALSPPLLIGWPHNQITLTSAGELL